MKKLILFIAVVFSIKDVSACTLYWADGNNRILCAKNMDWSNPESRMLFIPSSDGKYGRVYFGIQSAAGFTNTSGMNEMGLWYGGASLPERKNIYNTYNKPRWEYELIEKVMEECATVDEAIEIFKKYWEPHWNGHTLIADKYGNYVVIEYGDHDVEFLHNNKKYQVMTNFYLIDSINSRWYNCYRYNVAKTMLENSQDISFHLFRNIAEATHAKGKFQTVLTTIHDVRSGDIQLYHMHNFHEFLTINLFKELEKGEHYLKCSDYFSKIKIQEAEIAHDKVKLVWTGESDSYLIQYSKYPDFREQTAINYTGLKKSYDKSTLSSGIFFVILVYSFALRKKKISLSLILSLFILILSCQKIDIEPQFSKRHHEINITGLEPQTTYYWKICSMNIEYTTNSIISSFKTL